MIKILTTRKEFDSKYNWTFVKWPYEVPYQEYIVTDVGDIFRIIDPHNNHLKLAKCDSKGVPNHRGQYMTSFMTDDGKQIRVSTAKVVARAFVDGYDDKHDQIIHIDGNKENVQAGNLKWASHYDIMQIYWKNRRAKEYDTSDIVKEDELDYFNGMKPYEKLSEEYPEFGIVCREDERYKYITKNDYVRLKKIIEQDYKKFKKCVEEEHSKKARFEFIFDQCSGWIVYSDPNYVNEEVENYVPTDEELKELAKIEREQRVKTNKWEREYMKKIANEDGPRVVPSASTMEMSAPNVKLVDYDFNEDEYDGEF